MAKILSKSGISTLQIVRPWHVTQSIDAFTGTNAYDITLSGSMIVTGSIAINGLSSTVQSNIITYNTSSGQLGFTASSAIGGGGGSTSAAGNNYEVQFNSASAFQANSNFKFNYLSSSLEQGFLVTAIGEYSHAQGLLTIASGASSHAEGVGTLAFFTSDHAEGYQTTASSVGWPFGSGAASAAHSEGFKTRAYGIAAHAEGSGSYVSASHAHAEGIGTFAKGISSHAEGSHTTSSGEASHAEGIISHASGIGSHAEGGYTLAVGNNDHAEGYQTTASSVGWPAGGGTAAAAHAEGYNTIAYGIASHAEGYGTLTSASNAHAEGYGTIANGTASHAEGFLTTASGDYSHAAGYYTYATGSGVGQSVIGWFNEPITGRGDFIIGNGTSDSSRSNLLHASGSLVTVTGNISSSGTVTMATASIGGGIFTSASLAAGGGSTFPFTGSAAILGTLSLDGPSGHITASGNISSSIASTASLGQLNVSGEITVPRYIRRRGDADTYVEFLSNKLQLQAGGIPFITVDKDASTPYPLTINNGGNRINFRVQDENSDLLLKTNSEEFWAGLYFAGDQKLVTTSSGVNITGNVSSSGTFIGDGSTLTNLQRPITSSGIHFTASVDNAGYYFRTGGNVTCSIQTNASVAIPTGTEYEFFQTASVGYLIFTTGSGVTLNSKSGNTKLAGQFSAATLKKVGTNEFDLIGDLG